jgi:hypothetical protein
MAIRKEPFALQGILRGFMIPGCALIRVILASSGMNCVPFPA